MNFFSRPVRYGAYLVAGLLASVAAQSAGAAPAPSVFLVDPFLVAKLDNGGNQGNLELGGLFTKRNWTATHAAALIADNTSAAIVVVQASVNTLDVKLTATNGAILEPYDPKFLTKAPVTSGRGTLTIPKSQFVRQGGAYYAAALLQAPVSGAYYNVLNPITVTAAQDQTSKPATMALNIPPVVLVHGLWGDQTSLQNLQTYLLTTPQWKATGLVDAICYSTYLAFDATKDPMTGNGDGCEVTSQQALSQEVQHLMAVFDAKHIVGGRIDVAAHSMGGLVVRHFSTRPNYRMLRNRNQGAFHVVATIDTPETGSNLATYLVQHAGWTRHASFGSGPYNLWEAECDSGDTVETCFAKLGQPLSAPSQPLSTGAVYSLIPGGPSLKAAPAPHIPGTVWRAITATWPQTDRPSSLLRSVLNTLIRAIYNDNQAAPDTSSILGSPKNDVIVTTASQNGGAPVVFNFFDLAHTKTPDASVLGTFFDGTTQNVLQDDTVDRVVGCWLAHAGAADCSHVKPSAQPAVTVAAETAPQPARFGAFNRMTLAAPAQAPQLGVPFELPVRFASAVSRTLSVSQSAGHGEIESGSGPAVIARSAGGVDYIRVTPQRIGPMTFTVAAKFADGGVAVKRINVNVRAPSTAPAAFSADNSPVVIALDSADPLAVLHPKATYEGVGTIALDARQVAATVREPGTAVVSVQNGVIHALKPGEATIEARYAGKVDQIQVIVKPSASQ